MTNFPRSVIFIISNEFCERFNYYGLRAILSLYLCNKLNYDETSAIFIFHIFSTLVYFFPLFGAIVADTWLGKYRTILYLSVIYALGGILLAVGAIPLFDNPNKWITWTGLLFIAMGTGGIKPCVSAFGGDQFKLPQQAKYFAVFFSLFYAAINAGSLISTLVTPILRENVECFDENDCYSLAFLVPAVLMVLSIVIFISGRGQYIMQAPTGRLNKILKCILYGIYKRFQIGNGSPQDHWLDYATPRYGNRLVREIKVLLNILVLFIPFPMFWALFDQQGSRWTFQATRMDPRVGSFHVKPDQLQFLNPLLIIIFIPLFKYLIYPMMKKCHIRKPLQKMTIGSVLIMLSFVVAGLLENRQYHERLSPVLPPPEKSTIMIFNGYPCDFKYQITDEEAVVIRRYSKYSETLDGNAIMRLEWIPLQESESCQSVMFSIKDTMAGEINTYLVRPAFDNASKDDEAVVQRLDIDFKRPKSLNPDVTILLVNNLLIRDLTLGEGPQSVVYNFNTSTVVLNQELPGPGVYKLSVNGSIIGEYNFEFAQNSIVIVGARIRKEVKTNLIVLVKPFSMGILLLVPQYILATAGEIMFSITGLEFSYSQAPRSMKSILQACWLMAVAIGNLIVVLVTKNRFFENPSNESYLFGVLMFLDIMLFVVLARMYKPVEPNVDSDSDVGYVLETTVKPKFTPRPENELNC